MIRIVYAPRFLKSAKRMPEKMQHIFAKLLLLLQENPFGIPAANRTNFEKFAQLATGIIRGSPSTTLMVNSDI